MPVCEMLDRIPSYEMTEWMAYSRIKEVEAKQRDILAKRGK